ncbi:MAG TPA: AI-2E family transporter [Bryobacteraceae bacterium]|jgi:predicted PurR-regulated permease PerM|nr:AI-2E family transporter [Bryobacteraceae bacterium]
MELPPQPDFLLCISRGLIWRLSALAAACLLIWYAGNVLVVAFAGILVAVMLRLMTALVQRATGLGTTWSFAIVLILLAGFVVLCGLFLGPHIAGQGAEIAKVIPAALNRARDELRTHDWGRYLDSGLTREAANLNLASKFGAWASGLLGVMSTGVIVLAVGIFAAANPEFYENWFLRFVSEGSRGRIRRLVELIETTLRGWLLGQLVPMFILGVGTFVGLWAMHIPLAFTLALLTAFLLFVPYVGSVLSLIPAALVALMQGPGTMFSVVILYVVVHTLEGYVLTPLVQRKAVRLPPVVTILVEFLMWTIAGVLGVIVATPLAAAGLAIANFYRGERAAREQRAAESKDYVG